MAESIVKYLPEQDITCHASAAIVGARCVSISGVPVEGNPTVAPSGAGAKVFGIAATDAATGAKVAVHHSPGGVYPVEVGTGGVTAGAVVEAAATGTVVTRSAGIPVGTVTETAAAGAQVFVHFAPHQI